MKKRILTILILLLAVLTVGCLFIGCDDDEVVKEKQKTIYIKNPWGGTTKQILRTVTRKGVSTWFAFDSDATYTGPEVHSEGYILVGLFSASEGGMEYEDYGDIPAGAIVYQRYTPDPNCVIKMFDVDANLKTDQPIFTVGENLYDAELRNMPVPTDLPEFTAFDGWYADKELTVRITDGEGVVVPERKILNRQNGYIKNSEAYTYVFFAKYSYPSYTVTFKFGGEHQFDDVVGEYKHNAALVLPDVKDGEYVVRSWTTDSSGYNAYDVTQPVTGDLTLYAVWRRHGYVGLWSGGEKVKEFDLYEGESEGLDDFGLTYPGKTFEGWYTSPEFNPSEKVTTAYYNTGALYAHWI